jgi:hypothetical protein
MKTFHFGLEFVTFDLGSPLLAVRLKWVSYRDDQKFIGFECASAQEFEQMVNKLIKELNTLVRQAHRRHSDWEKQFSTE